MGSILFVHLVPKPSFPLAGNQSVICLDVVDNVYQNRCSAFAPSGNRIESRQPPIIEAAHVVGASSPGPCAAASLRRRSACSESRPGDCAAGHATCWRVAAHHRRLLAIGRVLVGQRLDARRRARQPRDRAAADCCGCRPDAAKQLPTACIGAGMAEGASAIARWSAGRMEGFAEAEPALSPLQAAFLRSANNRNAPRSSL